MQEILYGDGCLGKPFQCLHLDIEALLNENRAFSCIWYTLEKIQVFVLLGLMA